MAIDFKLPELGEGVQSADVSRIHVSEGDQIEAGQNIMELETEKAVADLPCPHAGTVTKLHVSEGDTIEIGQTIATIEENEEHPPQGPGENQEQQEETQDEEDQEQGKDKSPKAEKKQRTETDKPEATARDHSEKKTESAGKRQREEQEADGTADSVGEDARQKDEAEDEAEDEPEDEPEQSHDAQHEHEATGDRSPGSAQPLPPPAGPATRRLARLLEVDLDDLAPAEAGRIRPEDVVRAYVESGKAAMMATESLPDFTRFGPVEREPLNKIAQTAARRLASAWRSVPHVTQHGLADITKLEAARRQYVNQGADGGSKITLTSIAVKSVASLLKEFPKFNASLDVERGELILKQYYHVGVAVDTDHGLLVPVIRDVDRKSIARIATELTDLADKARRRQLGKDDFEGGTFTVSNQGGIGGGEFTPIVNYPEVAILGMARARPQLCLVSGELSERLLLPLCLSYDHRVINGADAARFIDRLAKILADEFSLLVAT